MISYSQEPAQASPLPKSIKTALLQGVKKGTSVEIKKDQHNAHGNYDYASVDAVYEVAQEILAEVGLGVYLTEKAVIYDGDKRIMFVFQFHLFTEEDEWTSPDALRTIIMPFTGPQTSQAAQSYVEKALFKHLLKLKTGDREPEDSGLPGVDLAAAKAKAKEAKPKLDNMKARALTAKIVEDLVKSYKDKSMTSQDMTDFSEKWAADLAQLPETEKTVVRAALKDRQAKK
jgi:hypothetical protein